MTTHDEGGKKIPVEFGIREWVFVSALAISAIVAWQIDKVATRAMRDDVTRLLDTFQSFDRRLTTIESTRFTNNHADVIRDRISANERAGIRVETLLISQEQQMGRLGDRLDQLVNAINSIELALPPK